MFHAYKDYVSRETYVPQPDVPRGTKLMLLITNVLACGTPVEHSCWEGLFPIVPGSPTIQLVTSANHLVDVNEMVHVVYGKIHAVIRQISELV